MTAPLSAVDFVSQEVRRQIWAGELRGGDRLNQADLAESLGVSRIPVREALIGLGREGLVEITPRRGARVVALSACDVRDHYELYGIIDGFALAKALERADDAALARFAHLADEIVMTDEPPRLQAIVAEFRRALYDTGGSPRLQAVAAGLQGLVDGNFFEAIPEAIPTSHKGYARVAAAIRGREFDVAVAAYRAMLDEHGQNAVAMMAERGLLDGD